jgi:hypothetical protein
LPAGAEAISDFRVMGDQQDLFGLVASVPTAWRMLAEIGGGAERPLRKMTAAVNAARRRAWAGVAARHGAIPGVRVADKLLGGVTCILLDASVVTCHSDKEGAEPNFKGFGLHPLLAYCDNTGEPLAGMLRPGSAGSNTAADHLAVLDAAITALPPGFRRLMGTCDGAGASHDLIARLDKLAARPGYQLIYSAGWDWAAGSALRSAPSRPAPGRSRSMPAARSVSGALTRRAATWSAPGAGAGSKMRTSPS